MRTRSFENTLITAIMNMHFVVVMPNIVLAAARATLMDERGKLR